MASSARPAWPPRRWAVAAAWALWALAMLGLVVTAWFDRLLGQAGAARAGVAARRRCGGGPLGGERGHGWGGGGRLDHRPVPGAPALAIAAAIARYRLYDLDRIISRTLAYGLLTLLLGGGYALVVLGLGQLLGRDSSLVVAAATLAVAACSSGPAGASSGPWTAASTGAATTPH